MTLIKKGDFTGFSNSCIEEALNNALQKVGEHSRFEVIETLGSVVDENKPQYQITIRAFFD